jgi:hypothetical protein
MKKSLLMPGTKKQGCRGGGGGGGDGGGLGGRGAM